MGLSLPRNPTPWQDTLAINRHYRRLTRSWGRSSDERPRLRGRHLRGRYRAEIYSSPTIPVFDSYGVWECQPASDLLLEIRGWESCERGNSLREESPNLCVHAGLISIIKGKSGIHSEMQVNNRVAKKNPSFDYWCHFLAGPFIRYGTPAPATRFTRPRRGRCRLPRPLRRHGPLGEDDFHDLGPRGGSSRGQPLAGTTGRIRQWFGRRFADASDHGFDQTVDGACHPH